MPWVTQSQFRARQSEYVATVQREPVEVTSRGARRCAVLVSPEFFDKAMRALGGPWKDYRATTDHTFEEPDEPAPFWVQY